MMQIYVQRRKAVFEFARLAIPDVVLVTPTVLGDARGFFLETYKRSDFVAGGIDGVFLQDNYSHSVGPVLRGLHYQNHPAAMGKLVGVRTGTIFDVAVDIRRGSPWYGRWVGAELSDENKQMLWIPEGFAHGFLALSSEADVFYKCTGEYAPDLEAGIRFDDPTIAIQWPETASPILSKKDESLPRLAEAFHNFEYSGG